VPLAGDLEMSRWMRDHVDTPQLVCGYFYALTLPELIRDRTGDLAGLGALMYLWASGDEAGRRAPMR
jgi:hypothetical protein